MEYGKYTKLPWATWTGYGFGRLFAATVDVPIVGTMLIDGAHLAIGEPIWTRLLGEGPIGAHVITVAVVLVLPRPDALVRAAAA